MHKRLKEHEDEYNDRFQELNLEYCAKDKHGFAEMEKFTRERRGEKSEDERFKFTIENQKTVNEKKRDLLNTKVEIEPYITEDVPEDFGFDWWNIFAPFILPQDPSEEQLEKLYKMTEEKEEERKKARELREQR
jgi:hypothetical protein